jgi:hypothetical protein
MERSGFPETQPMVYQLFREWSGADFPKLSRWFVLDGEVLCDIPVRNVL